MKKILLIACVFVFAAVMAHAAEAQSDPVNGEAKAKIVEAVELKHADGDALNFGIIVKPTAVATVVVNPAASAVATNTPSTLMHVSGETISADHFTIEGLGDAHYAVNLPTSAITLSDGASHTMTVDTFTTNATGTNNTATEFYVGGTLHIGSGQDAGEYKGQYPVTITY